jgi:periplasmic protein TonB
MLDMRAHLQTLTLGGWIAAATVVVGLHAGGIGLATMEWPQEDLSYDAAGVVTIELAPIATSVAQDNPDIAPGPVMQEAPNTPDASKKAETTPEEAPQVEPSPEVPKPEVAVAQQTPEPEKKPEVPKEEAKQEQKTEASVGDPITAAPAKTEAPVAEKTVAPVAGTGRTSERAQATWQKSLILHLNAKKRYPPEAQARGVQGEAKVQFSIDRAGRIISAHLITSSGHIALDEEALAVLRRASPLPAPPEGFGGDIIALTLPIQFRIR